MGSRWVRVVDHSHAMGPRIETDAQRAKRERGEARRAMIPRGHHSRRKRCPTAALSAITPCAISRAASAGDPESSGSRRHSSVVAPRVTPAAANGRPAAMNKRVAMFHGDGRRGVSFPGCRSSRSAADVPYSKRRRIHWKKLTRVLCWTTTPGSYLTSQPLSVSRQMRSTSSPSRKSGSNAGSASAERRTRSAAVGTNAGRAPGCTSPA